MPHPFNIFLTHICLYLQVLQAGIRGLAHLELIMCNRGVALAIAPPFYFVSLAGGGIGKVSSFDTRHQRDCVELIPLHLGARGIRL